MKNTSRKFLKFKFIEGITNMMNENSSKENPKSEEERFYEPRNWDKVMRIEDEFAAEGTTYCGRCGHIIYGGDKFCTKCGAESKSETKI